MSLSTISEIGWLPSLLACFLLLWAGYKLCVIVLTDMQSKSDIPKKKQESSRFIRETIFETAGPIRDAVPVPANGAAQRQNPYSLPDQARGIDWMRREGNADEMQKRNRGI